MIKHVLVTGGLGFIGSNLIRTLLSKTEYSVIIFDKVTKIGRMENLPDQKLYKKRLTFIKGDITKRVDIENAIKKADVVVHLAAKTNAAESINAPEEFLTANIKGTLLMLQAAEKYKTKKIILLSSSEVYGNKVLKKQMNEDHPIAPITPYAVSKFAAEQFALSYYRTKNLPVVVLRAFNVYGPFQYPDKMIPLSIINLINNKSIHLNNGGRPLRDWVYVEDIAEAIVRVINYKKDDIFGHTFNLGTGKATSIRLVADHILKSMNKTNEFLDIDYGGTTETMGNVGVSLKAETVLKWKAKTALPDGIKKTVKWYTENSKWKRK